MEKITGRKLWDIVCQTNSKIIYKDGIPLFIQKRDHWLPPMPKLPISVSSDTAAFITNLPSSQICIQSTTPNIQPHQFSIQFFIVVIWSSSFPDEIYWPGVKKTRQRHSANYYNVLARRDRLVHDSGCYNLSNSITGQLIDICSCVHRVESWWCLVACHRPLLHK